MNCTGFKKKNSGNNVKLFIFPKHQIFFEMEKILVLILVIISTPCDSSIKLITTTRMSTYVQMNQIKKYNCV